MTTKDRILTKEFMNKKLIKLEMACKAVFDAGLHVDVSQALSSAYITLNGENKNDPIISDGRVIGYHKKQIRISNHTVQQSDSGADEFKYCTVTGGQLENRESYHADKAYFAQIKSSKANLAENILKALEIYR